jgi:ABC-type branched-subunit amino acid transport system substrate-binding protein
MTSSRTLLRGIALGCALGFSLVSCALFEPEKVAQKVTITQTLPGEPLREEPPPLPGGAPAGPQQRVVFRPGTIVPGSGVANYASDQGVSASEIRIGTIQPMDGPAAQLGRPLYLSTQAYVNALNARGGINGRRVKLFLQTACINCEAENKLAAKALVEDKKVFAIVNTYMNTYAFASALKYLNSKKVPLIQGWSGSGSERSVWGAQQTPWNVYYTVRNQDGVRIYVDWLDRVMSEWIRHGDISDYKVGTVSLNVPQDNRRADEFRRLWEAKGGTHRVVSQQREDADEETVTRPDSFINAMQSAGANGVFSASNATMVFGMQAAKRRGWKVPWVAKSAWGRTATDLCGSACDGAFTDNNGWGWPLIDTPQMRQYREIMRRFYPDSTDDAQTFGGYIGMMCFEYAATRLGADLKRGALMDVLTNLANFDTGIGAVINTRDAARSSGGDAAADHLGMRQTMMLQMCDNKFWRVSDWLSPGGPMRYLGGSGSRCGWGY